MNGTIFGHLLKTFAAPFVLVLISQSCACKKEDENTFKPPTIQTPEIPYYLASLYKEPTNNPTTKEGVELGKMLFFDPQLSANGTISCATCHKPENAFADTKDKSVGIGGTTGKRNSPTIYNVGLFRKLFWDGRDTSLEQQSLHPIQDPTEMGSTLIQVEQKLRSNPIYPPLFAKAFGTTNITSELIAKALAQFERSLVSYGSKFDRANLGLYSPTPEEQLGRALFQQHPYPGLRGGNCGDCHLPNALLGNQNEYDGFHNNGLESSFSEGQDIGLKNITGKDSDLGKFKTPNLRNIALTAPYMHDGRFKTLEEVLDHYNSEDLFSHPNVDPLIKLGSNIPGAPSLGLTEKEKKAIIAFLNMLTDSAATRSFQP